MTDLERDPNPSLADILPGLLRVARSSVERTVDWAWTTTVTTAREVAGSIAAGEPPVVVVARATAPTRAVVRDLLGLFGRGAPAPEDPTVHTRPGATVDELRAKASQLLYDSADVWFEGDTHPAYARILDELTPDEARILRLLALDGSQPSIDVRTSRPLGVGSELVEGGLSMVGLHAGVRHQDRTRADLNNLERLGLVWFSREPVADPSRYQVVEVQPDVIEVLGRAGRSPKTVHRSIELTPFGADLYRVCFAPPSA